MIRTPFRAILLSTVAAATLIVAVPSAHAQSIPRPGAAPRPATGSNIATPPREVFSGSGGQRFNQGVSDGSVDQARQQVQGNYGSLERPNTLPLGQIQDAWSQPTRNMATGQMLPGTVHFNWGPDLIMPVRLRTNMITKVILPDWERVTDVISGDDYNLQALVIQANMVGIKTVTAGIDTTVDIVGSSGNVYTLYVRAEGFNTDKITDINVFVKAPPSASRAMSARGRLAPLYSADQSGGNAGNLAAVQNAVDNPQLPPPATDSVTAPTPEQMIFNMAMFEVKPGDREIAPELVYTDAAGWTYFDFGGKAGVVDRPAVFKVVDGVETRVNTRTIGPTGNIIVAESTGYFVLRAGAKIVCIRPAEVEAREPMQRSDLPTVN